MTNLHAAGLRRLDLTDRDLRILAAYAEGQTDRQIAKALGVSQTTVGTSGYRLRLRLGARDRANAVGIAYETGILKPGAK
jgi:DNA-binding NarL/FixJ family response regulator